MQKISLVSFIFKQKYDIESVKKTRKPSFLSLHTQLGPREHYVIACLRQSEERQKEMSEMESVLFHVFWQGPGIDRIDGGEIVYR